MDKVKTVKRLARETIPKKAEKVIPDKTKYDRKRDKKEWEQKKKN